MRSQLNGQNRKALRHGASASNPIVAGVRERRGGDLINEETRWLIDAAYKVWLHKRGFKQVTFGSY